MLRVALIPHGAIDRGGDGEDKLCVFVADWMKIYKSFVPYLKVFKNDLYLSLYLQYIKTIIQYNTTSRVRIYRGQLH